MSGTASASVREPSQTANLRFLKSSAQQPCLCSHSPSVTTEDKGGVGLTPIPASSFSAVVFDVSKKMHLRTYLRTRGRILEGAYNLKTFQIWDSSHERQTN